MSLNLSTFFDLKFSMATAPRMNAKEFGGATFETPNARLRAAEVVANVYKEHGYLKDGEVHNMTIPNTTNPEELFTDNALGIIETLLTEQVDNPEVVLAHIKEGGVVVMHYYDRIIAKDGQVSREEHIFLWDVYSATARVYAVVQEKQFNLPTGAEGGIMPIATTRVISESASGCPIPLAILEAKGIFVPYPEYKNKAAKVDAEVSQLSKIDLAELKAAILGFNGLMSKLIAGEYEIEGRIEWVASLDQAAFDHLQNTAGKPRRACYGLTQIGDPFYYMGSMVVPILIERDNVIASVAKTHPDIALLLAGRPEDTRYANDFQLWSN